MKHVHMIQKLVKSGRRENMSKSIASRLFQQVDGGLQQVSGMLGDLTDTVTSLCEENEKL